MTIGVIALLAASGCSHEAEYRTQDGERHRGIVADSTHYSIVFRNAEDGTIDEVRRSDIVEIDHPGQSGRAGSIVGIVIGSAVALAGGGLLLHLATSDEPTHADPMGIVSFGGGALTVIGLSTVIGSTAGLVWRRHAYQRSVERSKPPSEPGHRR